MVKNTPTNLCANANANFPSQVLSNGGLSIRKKNFPRLDVTLGSRSGGAAGDASVMIDLEPIGGVVGPTEHLLTMVAAASMGVANVWRLPTMTMLHGGGESDMPAAACQQDTAA